MREEVLSLKDEIKQIREEENSLAYDLLRDFKKQNKRIFIIWVITFLALISVTCYTIYLLNDISTVEIMDMDSETGTNNYIGNDGDIINGSN